MVKGKKYFKENNYFNHSDHILHMKQWRTGEALRMQVLTTKFVLLVPTLVIFVVLLNVVIIRVSRESRPQICV